MTLSTRKDEGGHWLQTWVDYGGVGMYCETCQNDGPLKPGVSVAFEAFMELYPSCDPPEPITELPDEGEHPHQWRHE